MGWQRMKLTLLAVLLAANVILAVSVAELLRETSRIPTDSIRDAAEILAEENILVNTASIDNRRYDLLLYSGNWNEAYYSETAAALTQSGVVRSFTAPSGVVLTMENGDRCVFSDRFGFRYEAFGSGDTVLPDTENLSAPGSSQELRIRRVVQEFLGRISFGTTSASPVSYDVTVLGIEHGTRIAWCEMSQYVRGTRIVNLTATAAVRDGQLIRMEGAWCFAEPQETISAHLLDQINILYSMKNRITPGKFPVWIESLNICYTVYFHASADRFYLIPAWDTLFGSGTHMIVNAIDGSLYTN